MQNRTGWKEISERERERERESSVGQYLSGTYEKIKVFSDQSRANIQTGLLPERGEGVCTVSTKGSIKVNSA